MPAGSSSRLRQRWTSTPGIAELPRPGPAFSPCRPRGKPGCCGKGADCCRAIPAASSRRPPPDSCHPLCRRVPPAAQRAAHPDRPERPLHSARRRGRGRSRRPYARPRGCARRARRKPCRARASTARPDLQRAGDGRLRSVPDASSVLHSYAVAAAASRRSASPKMAGGSPGMTHPERDTPIFKTAMCRSSRRRRSHVDGACHSTCGMEPSEIRLLVVDPDRQRVRSVDVPLDDRRPRVRQISRQLELHPSVVNRNRRWQDQRLLSPFSHDSE